jgi:hypothetical protein
MHYSAFKRAKALMLAMGWTIRSCGSHDMEITLKGRRWLASEGA